MIFHHGTFAFPWECGEIHCVDMDELGLCSWSCSGMVDQTCMDHYKWLENEMSGLAWRKMFGQCCMVCKEDQMNFLVNLVESLGSKWLVVLSDFQLHLL